MRKHSAFCFIGIIAIAANTEAQVCKLRGPDQAGDIPGIRCLDITSIENDTIVVPSNVTTIGSDGLAICPIQASNSQIPAVVFIMDQSASMGKVFNGIPAGDPHGYRAPVVRNAIQYLYNTAKSGWFAYIEFATDIEVSIQPEHADCTPGINAGATHLISQDFTELTPANVATWTSPTGPIQNRCQTGTNYFTPLHRAKQYIAAFNPGDVETSLAVVFVSDGRPNKDTDKTFDPLKEDYVIPGKFPPIHGIFLGGDESADGDMLAQLTTATGGTYNLVNGADTASLAGVMNQIINTIVRFNTPSQVAIRVGDDRYTATGVSKDAAGGFQVIFPQSIPLKSGMNRVEISATYRDNEGIQRTRTVSFHIHVNGPPAPKGITPTGNYFVSDCSISNILKINGLENPVIPVGGTLSNTPILFSDSLNRILLDFSAATHRGDSSGVFKLISKRTGDFLETQIRVASTPGKFLGTIPVQSANLDAQGIPASGNPRDYILQLAPWDTLIVTWKNPTDPRDTLRASVLIYQKPRVQFGADTLGIDQIITRIRDAAVLGSGASFTLQWGDGTPIGTDQALRHGNTTEFSRIADMRQLLRSAYNPRLVVLYTDPLFRQIYADTAWLTFRVPVTPRVWMSDLNGDGRADQLTLAYAEPIPQDQQFGRLQIVWGLRDQDTLFLRIDSINPAFTDFVQVTSSGTSQRWIITMPQPLPFGHTSGSGPKGQGVLHFSGSFDGRPTTRILEIEDRVGPILLEMWVDPEDINLSYFKVSEPLGEQASPDWFLVTRGSNPEMGRVAVETKLSPSGIYSVRLAGNPENRILGGDKVRFVPERNGGVRDRNGIGAHDNNPPVIVRGFREPVTHVQIRLHEPMIQNPSPTHLPPPADSVNTEYRFRVLESNNDFTRYTDIQSGATLTREDLRGQLALHITAQLPMLNGIDSAGTPLEGFLIDGQMAWHTDIAVVTHFYDQIGQFICKKTAKILVRDSSRITPEGQIRFSLLWHPDSLLGLKGQSGRAIASGVIIAKTTTTMISVAQKDLTIYDENGQVSRRSIRAGDKRRVEDISFKKIGYRRSQ